jgi:hypothetical protein
MQDKGMGTAVVAGSDIHRLVAGLEGTDTHLDGRADSHDATVKTPLVVAARRGQVRPNFLTSNRRTYWSCPGRSCWPRLPHHELGVPSPPLQPPAAACAELHVLFFLTVPFA